MYTSFSTVHLMHVQIILGLVELAVWTPLERVALSFNHRFIVSILVFLVISHFDL